MAFNKLKLLKKIEITTIVRVESVIYDRAVATLLKMKDAMDPQSKPTARFRFIKSEPRCLVISAASSGKSKGATIKHSDMRTPFEEANAIDTDME